MSRKDFDKYLSQITQQYLSLNNALKELSEEVDENMATPEKIEQLKLTIQPVKTSFDTLNYIRYLLDKPTRKTKIPRYNKQNSKLLQSCTQKSEDVLQKNEDIIKKLSER